MQIRTIASLALAAVAASASAQPVVNVFAASRGAVVTGSSNIGGGNAGAAGAIDGVIGDGNAAFGSDGNAGTLNTIDIRTATASTATSFRFRSGNDGATTGFRRAASRVQLLADVDGDGTFETTVVNRSINTNYAVEPGNAAAGTTNLDLTLTFTAVTARNWRVVTTQGVSNGIFDGTRILEVELNATQALPSSEDGLYEVGDVGNGATFSGTNIFVGAPANVFDGRAASILRGNGTFDQLPTTLTVRTNDPATVSAFRLRALQDVLDQATTRVTLRADTDNDGTFETTVIDQSINPFFDLEPLNRISGNANELDVLFTFPAVTAEAWELSTTPFLFQGVVLREADLFGTITPACPADFNNDGVGGDVFDLFDFLSALDAGCP